MRILFCAAILSTLTIAAAAAQCDQVELEADLRYLASDALEGRGLGSAGLQTALEMVAARFRELGLQPAYPERGDPLAGYFQEFRVHGQPAPTANVIGVLPGTRSEAVIVGAHIDHLGRDPNLVGDQIFNGADDNASGVSALLAVARMLSEQGLESVDRSIIFIAFSGEESGLLGSEYYIAHPIMPREQIVAMINLDSIGRMEGERLYLFGTGTAQEFPDIVRGVNAAFGFDLILKSEGAGAADHTSFFTDETPVLHVFAGPHPDYHKVSDEVEKVNLAALVRTTDYVGELVRYLSYRTRGLTFDPSGLEAVAKMEAMRAQGPRRVSLGFMPDFSASSGGVLVGMVTPGGVAEEVGIQKGDRITAIDGDPIDTLTDYSAILRAHVPGDHVRIAVRRGAETLQIEAVLQERK